MRPASIFSQAQVDLANKTFPEAAFRQGDAEALPFDDGSFDAVVVGFGINHLPHAERAFAEAFRVLRSRGFFVFTVWAALKPGQAFGIVLGAIEADGAPGAKLPPAPPYFRLADAEKPRRVFEQTGFAEPGTRLVDQFWCHESPDQVFDAFNEGAMRATAMLRSQSSQVLRENPCRRSHVGRASAAE